MFLKTIKKINTYGKSVIKIGKDIQFTISPFLDKKIGNFYKWNVSVTDVKGDIEFVKLVYTYKNSVDGPSFIQTAPFDKTEMIFRTASSRPQATEIYYLTNVEWKPVASSIFQLQISQARFQYLEPNQMFVDKFVLSEANDNLSFKYYGKRVNKENIQIHIENPLSSGIKINGEKGDFHFESKLQDIDLMLSFIYELSEPQQEVSTSLESRPISVLTNIENVQNSPILHSASSKNEITVQNNTIVTTNKTFLSPQKIPSDEINPISTQEKNVQNNSLLPILTSATENEITNSEMCPSNCKWYNVLTNKNYYDIILISASGKRYSCHHSILTKNSHKFAKAFEDSETFPIILSCQKTTDQILQSALDFLNGTSDGSVEKEKEMFYFADEWNIPSLMEACCPFMKTFVQPSNVCQIIQTAFDENLEETKKLCKKFILENKAKINSAELDALPQKIMLYVFCF